MKQRKRIDFEIVLLIVSFFTMCGIFIGLYQLMAMGGVV